jgi:hypothetical protein
VLALQGKQAGKIASNKNYSLDVRTRKQRAQARVRQQQGSKG